jgi:uncharacterized protein
MIEPTSVGASGARGARVRIAAAGDVHCDRDNRDALAAAFAEVDGEVDAILLAGDLTTHGEPGQAGLLAEICAGLGTPVVAVLGNHDLHAGAEDRVRAALEDAGVRVLGPGRPATVLGEAGIGVAGTKGFVGGFRGHGLPDFGEPSLRGVYREGTEEVEALARGLAEISSCPFRVALLHYAPLATTLEGEPPEIWVFLGSDRLAGPLLEHRPDLALHGHAHAGRFEAELEGIPVYNVSVPVMGRDFWVFELTAAAQAAPGGIH